MSFAELVARADRAAYASLGGEPVTYDPAGTPRAVVVTGLFDLQYSLAKGDGEAGVGVLGPAVFLRLSDLPSDPDLDDPTLTIRGVVYRVIERMPDGIGGIVLTLRRVT